MKHNCNTFSEDLCQFLCGSSIPKYILDLPQELLSTPIGQSLAPLIESLSARTDGSSNFSFEPQITVPSPRSPSPDLIEINTQIEQIRAQSNAIEESRKKSLDKIARREHKKEKKKKKHRKSSNDQEKVSFSEGSEYNSAGMSEIETNGTTATNGDAAVVIPSEMLPSEKVLEEEAEERRAEEEKKKNREPPVVYKEIDVSFCWSLVCAICLFVLIVALPLLSSHTLSSSYSLPLAHIILSFNFTLPSFFHSLLIFPFLSLI